MLVVAYKVNEVLVGNYSLENTDGVSLSTVILIGLTGLITIGNVVWLVF
jgi:hypothetical protein